jgi:Kdo2-lipid IVA lauroyltransferase/acyltransferase
MFLYKLSRILLRFFDRLPFGLLTIISDLFFVVIYHLIKYRKKVVVENLRNSFPGKPTEEIKAIARKFYKHFTDLLFEIIKLGSLPEAELFKRVTVSGSEVLSGLAEQNKSVVVVMSHSGNWEWTSQRVCFEGRGFEYIGVIAKEVSNPYFGEYFTNLRLRLQLGHAEIIPFTETAKHLAAIRHKKSMIITIADQTPHIDQIQYRTDFLHQDTAVFLGPERVAKTLNSAVVFCHVKKTSRMHYHIHFELITDTPQDCTKFDITNRHVKMLEEDIIAQPEIWLWSHRRWKY